MGFRTYVCIPVSETTYKGSNKPKNTILQFGAEMKPDRSEFGFFSFVFIFSAFFVVFCSFSYLEGRWVHILDFGSLCQKPPELPGTPRNSPEFPGISPELQCQNHEFSIKSIVCVWNAFKIIYIFNEFNDFWNGFWRILRVLRASPTSPELPGFPRNTPGSPRNSRNANARFCPKSWNQQNSIENNETNSLDAKNVKISWKQFI